MIELSITWEEKDAILEAIDLALEDQKQYLQLGGGAIDYADEWAEVAERKAGKFTAMGSLAAKVGAVQMAEDCKQLASEFMEGIEASK